MINYQIIAASINYYEQKAFHRVESPWTVTSAISGITKPPNVEEFTIVEKNKVLVASGEQSFLYLYNKGFLPKGRFQTVTPCFRNDSFDSIHTKYFIKNELIITDDVNNYYLQYMVNLAKDFFEKYFGKDKVIQVQTGEQSYDLFVGDIELGSYGIRQCDFLKWIYGTGVAEPRLTRTLKKYGIS